MMFTFWMQSFNLFSLLFQESGAVFEWVDKITEDLEGLKDSSNKKISKMEKEVAIVKVELIEQIKFSKA